MSDLEGRQSQETKVAELQKSFLLTYKTEKQNKHRNIEKQNLEGL